uniref:Transposase n=1 Tax=Strongyloides papillosus TaxID=174720 RepID=A0A0N5CIR1_STREA
MAAQINRCIAQSKESKNYLWYAKHVILPNIVKSMAMGKKYYDVIKNRSSVSIKVLNFTRIILTLHLSFTPSFSKKQENWRNEIRMTSAKKRNKSDAIECIEILSDSNLD